MNDPELEPLSPIGQALLELERGRLPPPSAQPAVTSRLEGTLGQGLGTHLGLGGFAKAGLAIAIFGLGAVTGGLLTREIEQSPRDRALPIAAPKSVQSPPAPSVAAPIAAPPQESPAREAKPKSRLQAAPSAPSLPDSLPDDALKAESLLLESARARLSSGQTGEAVKSLAEHQRQFPQGQLSEEREALWVQCLVISGDHEQARIRGERFRARYPNSLFLPAVEAALKSIP